MGKKLTLITVKKCAACKDVKRFIDNNPSLKKDIDILDGSTKEGLAAVAFWEAVDLVEEYGAPLMIDTETRNRSIGYASIIRYLTDYLRRGI